MDLRHEIKHEINYSDLITIRHRLSTVAYPDPHTINGKYLIRSLYFDNLLVRDNWAAIQYRIVYTENGVKEDKSMMQFFRFVEEEDGVKLVECWNK